MVQTYVVCDKCNQMNRVQLDTIKDPVCGARKAPLAITGALADHLRPLSQSSAIAMHKTCPGSF